MGWGWAIVLATALTSAGAPDAKSLKEAKRLFSAGKTAYQAGYYDAAAEAFAGAYELAPDPAIGFSLAQSLRLQYLLDGDVSNLRGAIKHYRDYMKNVRSGGRRKDAIEHLSYLDTQLAVLKRDGAVEDDSTQKTKTKLMITSQTPGAVAQIDGVAHEQFPVIIPIEAGDYEVEVSAQGFRPDKRTVRVVEGHLYVHDADLEAMPAKLSIQAEDGALVSIDDRPVGTAPITGALELAGGQHSVTITKRGHRPRAEVLELTRGEVRTLEAPLKYTVQRHVSLWFLAAGAVSLTTSFVAIVVALASEGQARNLELKVEEMINLTPEELKTYVDARDRRGDMLEASTAALAIGVVTGTIGAILYFLDNPQPELPAATLLPTAAGQPGASLHLTF